MKRRAFLGGLGGAAGGIAFAPTLGLAARPPRNQVLDRLREASIDVRSRGEIVSDRSAVSSETAEVTLAARGGRQTSTDGKLVLTATPLAGRPDALDLVSALRVASPYVTRQLVALDFRAWSRNNYVVLPGACYAGNRFQSRRAAGYPPLLTERADIGPHVPPIVPDIPHLTVGDGPSSLTVDASDLATPALGIFVPAARLGIIVMTDVETEVGRTTLAVEETADRARASVVVTTHVSIDPGRHLRPAPRRQLARSNTGTQLVARVHVFECSDIPALHERLFALRKDVTGRTALVNELPFSAAFARHEQRAVARWVEKPGFLAVGDRSSAYSTWQTGWCGGLVATLPLLAAGGKLSRERAAATVAFALDGGQALSGFFHGVSDGKTWTEDGFAAPLAAPATAPDGSPRPPATPVYKHARRWHLVRRTAEALTFLLKQIALLERRPDLRAAGKSERWAEAARLSADALVKLWERNKQLGQFVDIDSGELIVGGSTSAGLAPAGLALAAAQLKEPRYLQIAKAIGEHYYERFVRLGLTCGGPGDALQAPDSQSAAALLDSFMTLFEATRDRVWVDRARAAAHLLASWVIAYDRPAATATLCFGPEVRPTGAVYWTAAGGRGSPGYVLSSGDALLRLYRATGDVALLELLRDTVHNLAQYLPAGGGESAAAAGAGPAADCTRAAKERWVAPGSVVPVDGVFDTIGLLSYTEVPGIYVRPDTGFLFVFDHVTARIKERAHGRLVLTIANPTRSEATVRILSETADGAEAPLRPGAVLDAQTAVVPAGGSIPVAVPPA